MKMIHITDIKLFPITEGNFEVMPIKMLLNGKEEYCVNPSILQNEDYIFAHEILSQFKIEDFKPIVNEENFIE